MDATLLEGIPIAMSFIDPITGFAIGSAALSLFDQFFGSGKDARGRESEAHDINKEQAGLQTDEMRRVAALLQQLQGEAQGRFDDPQLPPEFADLSGVLSQFFPGLELSGLDYEAIGPGIVRGDAFEDLMRLAQPGITGNAGNAMLANATNQVNMGEAQTSEVLGNLLWALMNKKPGSAGASGSPVTEGMLGASSGLLGEFFNPFTQGSSPILNTGPSTGGGGR